ncbi:MAG: hypothetical protein JO250_06525 [Armatimonadetes bacterium]|nr:hypothetical protein [Armatimonadota bacterium]
MDNGLDRRGFLRLLSGGALAVASGGLLTGCGGGGGGGGSSPSGGNNPATDLDGKARPSPPSMGAYD